MIDATKPALRGVMLPLVGADAGIRVRSTFTPGDISVSRSDARVVWTESNDCVELSILTEGVSAYLIVGGKSSDFRRLADGAGFHFPTGNGFRFNLAMAATGAIRASALVIEFDASGERVSTHRFAGHGAQSLASTHPGNRLLLAYRFFGKGAVKLRSLDLVEEGVEPANLPTDEPNAGAGSLGDGGDAGPQFKTSGSALANALAWSTTPEGALACVTGPKGELQISSDKKEAKYLVLNGDAHDFKSLAEGRGMPVAAAGGLLFHLQSSSQAGIRVKCIIIAFDEKGRRLPHEEFTPNTPYLYRVEPGVVRVLLAVRLQGAGTVVFDGITIDRISRATVGLLSAEPVPIVAAAPAAPSLKPEHGVAGLARDLLNEMAAAIPVAGAGNHQPHPYRVGVIADVYMFNFYKDCFAEVVYITPENVEEVVEKNQIDLLIYTTCWSGRDGDEWRGLTYREKPQRALDRLIEHCAASSIPTVFQSIEDPSNFEYFLPIARKFDVVLTTDTDCIERYRSELGHDRVYYGEYGVNPLLNNPIGCRRSDISAAFFAGSYPQRYADRCADMESLFDSLIDAGQGLLIADRNFAAADPTLRFPVRYEGYRVGPVDHALLQRMSRLFRWVVNFNSIKDSPTMCAMRVYELQAQGRRILSNYAQSVFNLFPDIEIIPSRCDASWYFKGDPLEDYRVGMRSVRAVMTTKTAYDVTAKLLTNLGMASAAPPNERVGVFSEADEPGGQLIADQSHGDIVFLGAAPQSESEWRALQVEHSLGYFTWFSSRHEYERYYLADLVNAFKYTGCDYVTKRAVFADGGLTDGPQHEFVDAFNDRALTLFSAERLSPTSLETSGSLGGGYAIDPFEVNYLRYKRSQKKQSHNKPVLSVVVPVHNNGTFLRSKCIPSLQRNLCWDDMEIVLVDDVSSDAETLQVVDELEQSHRNVRVIRLEGEPSGSASVPRNRGVDVARAPLVSFLDPDNQISPGGYDELLRVYSELQSRGQEVDFVSGYQIKSGGRNVVTGKHTSHGVTVIQDLKSHFFAKGKFPVVSTQAAVISKDFLARNEIGFVAGAVGQDTLYGWELLALAKRAAFTDLAYLIYYAERAGSVTNDVSVRFFQKSLVLERHQSMRLPSLDVYETFKTSHFPNFFRNWYVKHLDRVKDSDRAEAETLLTEIAAIHGMEWTRPEPPNH